MANCPQMPSQQAKQKKNERMKAKLAMSAQRHIVKQVAMPESASGPAGCPPAAPHCTSCTPFSVGSISALFTLLLPRGPNHTTTGKEKKRRKNLFFRLEISKIFSPRLQLSVLNLT
jgi:hypothetical protein